MDNNLTFEEQTIEMQKWMSEIEYKLEYEYQDNRYILLQNERFIKNLKERRY